MKARDHARVWTGAGDDLMRERNGLIAGKRFDLLDAMASLAYAVARAYEKEEKLQEELNG